MNKESFDRLSPENQQVLLDVGSEVADYYGRLLDSANEDALIAMQAGIDGRELIVNTLADDQREILVSKGESYIADWVDGANEAGLDGEGLLQRLQTSVAKFEKQRDELGYPWEG